MTDESYSFTAAKTRLDEIVTQVRKKDTSLEKSLDLLEEGVRLANVCTELIDQTDWANAPGTAAETALTGTETESGSVAASGSAGDSATSPEAEDGAPDGSGEPPAEDAEDGEVEASTDEAVGDVWSEDEAWADEAEDDPSDGDDGHGD